MSGKTAGNIELEKLCSSHKWHITDFSSFCKNKSVKKYLESPLFSIIHSPKANSHLWFKLRLNFTKDPEDYSVSLISLNETAVVVSFELRILDEKLLSARPVLFNQEGQAWPEIPAKNPTSDKKCAVPLKDGLTICCEIIVRMSDSFNFQHSDLGIALSGKVYYAHKSVLNAKSKVFKQMTEQSFDNVFELTEPNDLNTATLEDMLRFIYLQNDSVVKDYSSELLAVANHYDIQELKLVCEKRLCDGLTIDNADKYLDFAVQNKIDKLRASAIKFIAAHSSKIDEKRKY